MILQIVFIAAALSTSIDYAETMTDSEARGTCDEVARLESESKLDTFVLNLSRLPTVKPTAAEQALIDEQLFHPIVRDTVRLEVAKGKPILFVSVSNGGSCANYSILPVVAQLNDISESYEPTMGGEDWILQHHGRTFLINRALDSGRLRDLAWITPAGRVQLMCSFETQRVVRSVGIHRGPLALCEALLAAPASAKWQIYEKLDSKDPASLKQLRDITGASSFDSTPEMATTRIDVDNDGRFEDLVRLNYTNSGGCGSHGSRLQVLDSARDRIADDPLNEVLQMTSTNGDPIDIYTVSGRQYVVANSETDGRVYSLSRKGAEEQCMINHRYVLRVSAMHLNGCCAGLEQH